MNARVLHLTVGKPPMVRLAGPDQELQPLTDKIKYLTWKDILFLLQTSVVPEKWEEFERVGEGELVLSDSMTRPIRLVMFRNSDAWSVVVHL